MNAPSPEQGNARAVDVEQFGARTGLELKSPHPSTSPPLAEVVDNIDDRILAVDVNLSQLVDRLAPVLQRPADAGPAPMDPSPSYGHSPLAERLSGTVAKLEAIVRKLRDVDSRLEL